MTAGDALARRERRVLRLLRTIGQTEIAHYLFCVAHIRRQIKDWQAGRPTPAEERALTKATKAVRLRNKAESRAPAGDVAEARRRLGLP